MELQKNTKKITEKTSIIKKERLMGLQINNVSVDLSKLNILKDVDLEINKGEYLALLGPSGSGKTTLLKSIAGLLDITKGSILLNGEDLSETPAYNRPLAVVFQDMRLFPHLDVYENIAFSLNLKKWDQVKIKKRVSSLLDDVQLNGFERKKIHSLSGGQQQRVALARALASEPELLLLDEPFSGLDEPLRREMGQLVYQLHQDKELTTLLITHDKYEAVAFSDRIAFIREGKIIQVDKPSIIINQPFDEHLASFFGRMNYLYGKVEEGYFTSGDYRWSIDKSSMDLTGGDYKLMVRPGKIKLIHDLQNNSTVRSQIFEAEIIDVISFPEYLEISVKIAENQLWTIHTSHTDTSEPSLKQSDNIYLKVQLDDLSYLKQ